MAVALACKRDDRLSQTRDTKEVVVLAWRLSCWSRWVFIEVGRKVVCYFRLDLAGTLSKASRSGHEANVEKAKRLKKNARIGGAEHEHKTATKKIKAVLVTTWQHMIG